MILLPQVPAGINTLVLALDRKILVFHLCSVLHWIYLQQDRMQLKVLKLRDSLIMNQTLLKTAYSRQNLCASFLPIISLCATVWPIVRNGGAASPPRLLLPI